MRIKDLIKLCSFKCGLLIGIIVLLMDQLSKYYIVSKMYPGEQIEITSFFNIVRVHNHGVAFGVLSGVLPGGWLVILPLIVMAVIAYWMIKDRQIIFCGTVIIIAALGNVIDRLTNGYVVDFLDFHIGQYHWPAFNMADAAIVCCNVIILLMLICNNSNCQYKEKGDL